MTRATRTVAAVVGATAAVSAGAFLASTASDTPPAPTNAIVQLTPAPTGPQTPSPEPPFGVRVNLGGLDGKNCAQNLTVTVRTTSIGLLIRRAPNAVGSTWVTKTESLDPATTPDVTPPGPPVFKGRMDPGIWQLQEKFSKPQTYRMYFANSNCWNLARTGAKWNASIITVKVVNP